MVKLNVDGSFREQDGSMGAGGLFRDSEGRWLFGFHGHRRWGNALIAEAQALLIGLDLAWDRGIRELVVEVDCQELLQSVGDEESRHFLPVLSTIKDMLERDWRVSLSRISRECNGPADHLAKVGAHSSSPEVCVLAEPPWEVETLVLRDSLLAR